MQLLFRMVVINGVAADAAMPNISGNQGGQRLVSINRHQELEEDTYMLWLCLLRVLPRNMEVVEHELRESIFSLFPLLLTYLTESDNSEYPGQMRVKSSPVLALDVVTEYVTVLLDYVKAYHPEGVSSSSKGGTAFANLYEKNGEILFHLIDGTINSVEFSISRVQALCLQCLKCTDEDRSFATRRAPTAKHAYVCIWQCMSGEQGCIICLASPAPVLLWEA